MILILLVPGVASLHIKKPAAWLTRFAAAILVPGYDGGPTGRGFHRPRQVSRIDPPGHRGGQPRGIDAEAEDGK